MFFVMDSSLVLCCSYDIFDMFKYACLWYVDVCILWMKFSFLHINDLSIALDECSMIHTIRNVILDNECSLLQMIFIAIYDLCLIVPR